MVSNNLDDGSAGSLRSVISHANTDAAAGISDTINFNSSLAGATIVLTQGQLELRGAGGGGTITIDASNLSSPIAISGNNASRVIQVDAGTTAIFSRLTLEGGQTSDINGGGGIYNAGTLTLSNSTLANNSAVNVNGGGGGISNFGTLRVGSSTFTGNSAPNFSGAASSTPAR
jgi:hypothetical protein